MPNKAIPQTQKIHDLGKEKDELFNEAAGLYLAEASKPKKDQQSSRNIAKDLEDRHFKETGHQFKLWHQTIIERSRGRRSQLEYASDHKILTPEEREVVLGYLTQSANQGFPLTHSRLKDVVDDILQARLGNEYPGVGQKY
ncbi:hypothetical protein FA15DRAFT_547809, partial [Coprinopsis marcescibilis]